MTFIKVNQLYILDEEKDMELMETQNGKEIKVTIKPNIVIFTKDR